MLPFYSFAKNICAFILNCYRRLLSSKEIFTCFRLLRIFYLWLSNGHLSVRQLFGLCFNLSSTIVMVTIVQFVFITLLIRCLVIFLCRECYSCASVPILRIAMFCTEVKLSTVWKSGNKQANLGTLLSVIFSMFL